MSEKLVKQTIGKVFNQLADSLISGEYHEKSKVAITTLGSIHGEEEILKGVIAASQYDIEPILIGRENYGGFITEYANTEEEAHKVMEELLDSAQVDAAITMHYTFPIGVSTVGRIITPGKGKEMFLATTTGTSSTDKVEGMVMNAIYGIITAKSCGIKNPSLGILNIDGARQTEIALNRLKNNGYEINFASSQRSESGPIMRGNDLLTGSADVMVMDSLTGNLMMKIFSAYTTGGSYESLGYGYGPGIGKNFNKLILIISRASGSPQIKGAIKFAGDLIKGKCLKIAKEEFDKAKNAGIDSILLEIKGAKKSVEEIEVAPEKEIVTSPIAGIDIIDLDNAVKLLWKNSIYAESGMGCTGPVILVNETKTSRALKILRDNNYIVQEQIDC